MPKGPNRACFNLHVHTVENTAHHAREPRFAQVIHVPAEEYIRFAWSMVRSQDCLWRESSDVSDHNFCVLQKSIFAILATLSWAEDSVETDLNHVTATVLGVLQHETWEKPNTVDKAMRDLMWNCGCEANSSGWFHPYGKFSAGRSEASLSFTDLTDLRFSRHHLRVQGGRGMPALAGRYGAQAAVERQLQGPLHERQEQAASRLLPGRVRV